MSRISLKDFSKGLILSPPPDVIAPNGLRRARGVHPVRTVSLRSRPGNVMQNSVPAVSLFVFIDSLYQFVDNDLYKDGIFLKTIISEYLTFLQAPPTAGKPDYLFISNGDVLWKVDSGGNITKWGIDRPINGFTAVASESQSILIDDMENPGAVARWSGTSLTVSADATNFVSGTQSINFAVTAAKTRGDADQTISIDLSEFASGDKTSDADYISFQIWIDEPDRIDFIKLQFSLNNTTFSNNFFSRTLEIDIPDREASNTNSKNTVLGLGNSDEFVTGNDEKLSMTYLNGVETTAPYDKENGIVGILQESNIKFSGEFTKMLLPLSSFKRSGEGDYDWSDIKAIRFRIKTNRNGAVNVKVDDLKLIGGAGLQGTYKYYVTYENSITGTRSNPNSKRVVIKNITRQEVTLSNLPIPTDTQVDKIIIWRTVGNGSVPFKCGEVNVGTTTFVDNIADTYALDPRDDVVYLSSEAIELSNIVPSNTLGACCYYNASVFWIDRDPVNAGHLYYSRIGYSETMEGFIVVTNNNDILQTVVLWNGVPYVFSKGRVFIISGTNPYYSKEVFGVPGTTHPNTVIPTVYGIFYRASDGIRLFNGVQSSQVGWDAIGRLFSGENVENLTSFIGNTATFARNEYIISDGLQTLAYNAREDRWRDIGIGFDALYTDKYTGTPYGSNSTGVYELERQGQVTDNGTPIVFESETYHCQLDVDKVIMVNHLHIDINTNGSVLEIYLVADDIPISLGFFSTTSRKVETIPIGKEYNRIALRLKGNLTSQIELFGIHLDADVEQNVLSDKYFKNVLAS